MTKPYDVQINKSGNIVATAESDMPLPIEADGTIRVSFADKEVIFTSEELSLENAYILRPQSGEHISRAKVTTFLGNYNYVVVISPDSMASFIDFASQFVWVEAAGGVVASDEGSVVMIRRNERWDLPKGHREVGESFAECAAREAEEETGAKVASVDRLLCVTLHCYNLYGKWEMKYTAWYAMRAIASYLTPQREEGIIQAEWIAPSCVEEKIKTSFPTIKKVFASFYE